MAQDVQIPGAGSTAKIRNPIAVAIFATITLGIYVLYWWYAANRERWIGRVDWLPTGSPVTT